MNCGTQWLLSENIAQRRDFPRSLAIATLYVELAMQGTTCSSIQSSVTGLFGLMQYWHGPEHKESLQLLHLDKANHHHSNQKHGDPSSNGHGSLFHLR